MRDPTKHLRLFLTSLAAAGWLVAALSLTMSAAFAQGPVRDLTAQSANIYAGGGGSLSAASGSGMPATVANFLATKGHNAATLASLVLTATHVNPKSGVTHLKFGQEVAGLGVYGTYVKAAFDGDGNLIHLIENLADLSGKGVVSATAAPRDALNEAMLRNHPGVIVGLVEERRSGNVVTFSGGGFFHRDPTVTRVAIAMENGPIAAGFLVETWTADDNMLHHTLVGGNGSVLGVELRTNNDSYNIFPIHPDISSQTVVAGPGGGITESPAGWLSGSQTTVNIGGNNANAYLDTDANGTPDPGGSSVPDGNFLTSANLSQEPSTTDNQAVAVQNLFYFNNVIHDKLYRHGFIEGAGNFQEDNFSNGGFGSDSVNAEGQDGGGLNNANFSTPSDGFNPRMQMFLWTVVGDHLVEVAGGPSYFAMGAVFGPVLDATGITDDVAAAADGTAITTDACEALTNGGAISGKIALIDRGDCDFVIKVKNAQNAGAVGVIIANNAGDGILTMGGTDPTINIPSVFVGQTDGADIRAALPVVATLRTNPTRIDGDLDSDIIWHEYGHGLTWRMIGNMSGRMSGAIGEGMSDTLAILANNDDVVGEYSTSDSIGIRSAPYTGYPRTYGDMVLAPNNRSVHSDGEIYAATIWHLWELFQTNAISQDTLFDYLIGGMNFTPSGPSFEDMRDGILQQASGTGHECVIWQAFADFGVGEGAQGTSSSVTESFTLPASCTGGGNSAPVADAQSVSTSEDTAVAITLTGSDPDGDALTFAVVTPPAHGSLSGTAPNLIYTPTAGYSGADSFTYQANDGADDSNVATVSITITPVVGGTDPVVMACAPSSGSTNQKYTVAVTGSNFQDGATVDFGGRIAVQGVTFVDSFRLDVRIKVNKRAALEPREVTVTNPDSTVGSHPTCFTVN